MSTEHLEITEITYASIIMHYPKAQKFFSKEKSQNGGTVRRLDIDLDHPPEAVKQTLGADWIHFVRMMQKIEQGKDIEPQDFTPPQPAPKKQTSAKRSNVRYLFIILAVAVIALVCYAVFYHPSLTSNKKAFEPSPPGEKKTPDKTIVRPEKDTQKSVREPVKKEPAPVTKTDTKKTVSIPDVQEEIPAVIEEKPSVEKVVIEQPREPSSTLGDRVQKEEEKISEEKPLKNNNAKPKPSRSKPSASREERVYTTDELIEKSIGVDIK